MFSRPKPIREHCNNEAESGAGQAALDKLQELARGHAKHGTPVGFARHRMAQLEGAHDGMREALLGLARKLVG